MVKIRHLILLLVTALLLGCGRQQPLVIEPISKESNEALLSGKNLDPRLYSTKFVFQYYQVSGYGHLSGKDLTSQLDSFVKVRYPVNENKHRKSLTVWFYKKQWFKDFENLVYESARENENGNLTQNGDDALAIIYWDFPDNGQKPIIRHSIIYYPEISKSLIKVDTLSADNKNQ